MHYIRQGIFIFINGHNNLLWKEVKEDTKEKFISDLKNIIKQNNRLYIGMKQTIYIAILEIVYPIDDHRPNRLNRQNTNSLSCRKS